MATLLLVDFNCIASQESWFDRAPGIRTPVDVCHSNTHLYSGRQGQHPNNQCESALLVFGGLQQNVICNQREHFVSGCSLFVTLDSPSLKTF